MEEEVCHHWTRFIHVVIFSKDRAFQLGECLRTLEENVLAHSGAARQALRGSTSSSSSSTCIRGGDHTALTVTVLYHAGDGSCADFGKSYAEISSRFPAVRFVREKQGSFSAQLGEILAWRGDGTKNEAKEFEAYTMFCVDDVVFHTPFDLRLAAGFLEAEEDRALGFTLKLWPGACYCHPRQALSSVPPLFRSHAWPSTAVVSWGLSCLGCREQPGFGPSSGGTLDWDYPWDLCCTMYRAAEAELVFRGCRDDFGEAAVANPNSFEEHGNRWLVNRFQRKFGDRSSGDTRRRQGEEGGGARELTHAFLFGCPSFATTFVVTVNRVQDVCANPVYGLGSDGSDDGSGVGGGGTGFGSPAWLDACLWRGDEIDSGWYRRNAHHFGAAHIGELRLLGERDRDGKGAEEGQGGEEEEGEALPRGNDEVPAVDLSIIMPVYNGEAFVKEAVSSVLRSLPASSSSSSSSSLSLRAELIVVDDGSTDGTVAVLKQLEEEQRREGAKKEKEEGTNGVSVKLRILPLPNNRGISAALNAGFAEARAPLLSRMDADDVCEVARLAEQVEEMRKGKMNKMVDVLGTAVEVFVEGDGSSKLNRLLSFPCHPLVVRWQMFFSCCIAHPTVMMRRVVLDKLWEAEKEKSKGKEEKGDGQGQGQGQGQRRGQERREKTADWPYRSSAEPAEDYDLWLRLLALGDEKDGGGSIAMSNSPSVGLRLRKHGGGVSAAAAAAAAAAKKKKEEEEEEKEKETDVSSSSSSPSNAQERRAVEAATRAARAILSAEDLAAVAATCQSKAKGEESEKTKGEWIERCTIVARRAADAGMPAEVTGAIALIDGLERAVLRKASAARAAFRSERRSGSGKERRTSEKGRRSVSDPFAEMEILSAAVDAVRKDACARVGEIATHAMTAFPGAAGVAAFRAWLDKQGKLGDQAWEDEENSSDATAEKEKEEEEEEGRKSKKKKKKSKKMRAQERAAGRVMKAEQLRALLVGLAGT